jgi:hypothetical protein
VNCGKWGVGCLDCAKSCRIHKDAQTRRQNIVIWVTSCNIPETKCYTSIIILLNYSSNKSGHIRVLLNYRSSSVMVSVLVIRPKVRGLKPGRGR